MGIPANPDSPIAVTLVGGSAAGTTVQGADASDAPVTANPLLCGGRASTATPSAVSADGDAVALWLSRSGAAIFGGTDGTTTRPASILNVGSSVAGLPALLIGARDGSSGASLLKTDDQNALRTVQSFRGGSTLADGISNSVAAYMTLPDSTNPGYQPTFGWYLNGSGTWDRTRGNTSGAFVQGPVADAAATSGNPVLIGGVYTTGHSNLTDGNTGYLRQTIKGALITGMKANNGASAGDTKGNGISVPTSDGDADMTFIVYPHLYNGSTWERPRTAVVGNNVASTGIAAAAPYGQYTTIANQPALTTGNYGAAQLDSAGNTKVVAGAPAIANILSGYVQHTATTAAATVITVPAGKTFTGTVTVSVAASKAATATGNGLVSALIATLGTGVTPAAGTIFAVSARIGANAATGTVGTQGSNCGSMPIIVNAPAGNTVTVTLASTLTNTTEGAVDCSIFGTVQ